MTTLYGRRPHGRGGGGRAIDGKHRGGKRLKLPGVDGPWTQRFDKKKYKIKIRHAIYCGGGDGETTNYHLHGTGYNVPI